MGKSSDPYKTYPLRNCPDCHSCRQAMMQELYNDRQTIKAQQEEIESYRSGRKIEEYKRLYDQEVQKLRNELDKVKRELAEANRKLKSMNQRWMEVNADVCKEKDTAVEKMQKQVDAATARADREQAKRYKQRDDFGQVKKDLEAQLKQEENRIEKLQNALGEMTVKQNKNYKNSSKPSSTDPNHGVIYNSREKSGLNPGGQPGHEAHGRVRQKPTVVIDVAPPEKYLDEDNYKATGKVITKQLVGVKVVLDVVEFRTPEFRNKKTGQRVHAEFPNDLRDDVTYDGSVKALAFLLNNLLNVSIDKTTTFISELTGGKLKLSNGMVCNLSKEFSQKTKNDRIAIFKELHDSPTLHADYTFTRACGKNATILVCASGDKVLFQMKKRKGKDGIKNSPLIHYKGILTSDHESAFVSVTDKHQECLAHVMRYCIAASENEPEKTWSGEMLSWIADSMNYWNDVHQALIPENPKKVKALMDEYDSIIRLAGQEYEETPPKPYFRDGFNLYKRMRDQKQDYVRFLQDIAVCPQNNVCERNARIVKRKGHQVITFRSKQGVEFFCDLLSVLQTCKAKGENMVDKATQVFGLTTTEAIAKAPELAITKI